MNLISIQEVEKAIANYRAAEAELAKHFGLKPARKARATNGNGHAKKVSKASTGALSGRQLQGKYMGALRHLKPRQQAKVKSVRAKDGIKAALKLAKSFA